jgi:hypothetical protein
MSSAIPKSVPHEMKTSLIKVFSYENKILEGSLVNPYFDKEIHFSSFVQLVMLIEDMLDDLCFPQKSMATRSFIDNAERPHIEKISLTSDKKPVAVFRFSVLFRQNASWQGTISWINGKMDTPFRSVLEMIHIVDGVLSTGKHEQALKTVS